MITQLSLICGRMLLNAQPEQQKKTNTTTNAIHIWSQTIFIVYRLWLNRSSNQSLDSSFSAFSKKKNVVSCRGCKRAITGNNNSVNDTDGYGTLGTHELISHQVSWYDNVHASHCISIIIASGVRLFVFCSFVYLHPPPPSTTELFIASEPNFSLY